MKDVNGRKIVNYPLHKVHEGHDLKGNPEITTFITKVKEKDKRKEGAAWNH